MEIGEAGMTSSGRKIVEEISTVAVTKINL